MTAVAETDTMVLTEPCRHCDFVFQEAPQLAAGLRYSILRYQQVGYVLTDPVRLLQHQAGASTGLDHLVRVRDSVHDYTNHLARFAAAAGPPVVGCLDPEPAQAYSQDYSTAMVGLTANLERLAEVIGTFPATRWLRPGVLHGRSVRAIDIGNNAVHEAAHHLVDLELLLERSEEDHFEVGPVSSRRLHVRSCLL